jgi:2-polyprenyl-3-methyl-5-hydroxy-6-metoxy-1,4-benzoquinol methylase
MGALAKISVVSCVNDFGKYNSCVRSSFQQELRDGTVELLPIDNTSNGFSAPAALNKGLKRAIGDLVVFCHQDVIFPQRWTEKLFEQISIAEKTHKNWGVLGTFGIARNGLPAGHIIGCGVHFYCPPLPAEVQSLDEHCLIIRKDSGLEFDENLGGFHLYGADICIQAMAKGLTNFAIDACAEHLSPGGKLNADFYEVMDKLYNKWKYKNPPLAVIETTCKVCRLQAGLKGRVAYEIVQWKRKRRRKKMRKPRVGIHLSKLSDKPKGYFQGTREEMLKYIPKSVRRTLEVGCGFGGFSALVKEKFGAETWAVEVDKEAAQEAAKKLDKVINSDIVEALNQIPDNYFDCVIFLDILEHLIDPYSLLVSMKQKLTDEGVIVTSIPNVRYYRNYIDFAIKGNWDYQDAGTLDKTHLRFFTYKSILKMFEQLGFEVLVMEGIHATRNKKLRLLNILLFKALEDLKYLQFAAVARPHQIKK